MDKYEAAQLSRQSILDYVNTVESCSTTECGNAIGRDMDYALRTMNKMVEIGDLGRKGNVRTLRFFALVERTSLTADEHRKLVIKQAQDNFEKKSEKRAKKKAQTEPWCTPHIVTEQDRPIPNQGGQGACRHQSWSRKYGTPT